MRKSENAVCIKTYATGNNDAPSITKYWSPERLDAQIVALRPHCTHYMRPYCGFFQKSFFFYLSV